MPLAWGSEEVGKITEALFEWPSYYFKLLEEGLLEKNLTTLLIKLEVLSTF